MITKRHKRDLPEMEARRRRGLPMLGHGNAQAKWRALGREPADGFNVRRAVDASPQGGRRHKPLRRRAGPVAPFRQQAKGRSDGMFSCHAHGRCPGWTRRRTPG